MTEPVRQPTDGPMTWFEAHGTAYQSLAEAAIVLALVRGAVEGGWFGDLVDATSPTDLARRHALPEEQIDTACQALALHGLLETTGGRYRLTEPWRLLAGPAAFAPLSTLARATDVEATLVRAGAEGDGGASYAALSAADRLAYATAISPDPFSPGTLAMMRGMREHGPEYWTLLDGADRLLELGCGVAGNTLSLLQVFPRLRVVGVELAPDLAEVAAQRAARLGLADRFEVVVADAADVDRPASFDVVIWSQFFFPVETRAAALATAARCLRPGGTVAMPILDDPAAVAADPTGAKARELARMRLVVGGWGVPRRTADELVDEVGAAGFEDVRVVPRGIGSLLMVVGRASRK